MRNTSNTTCHLGLSIEAILSLPQPCFALWLQLRREAASCLLITTYKIRTLNDQVTIQLTAQPPRTGTIVEV